MSDRRPPPKAHPAPLPGISRVRESPSGTATPSAADDEIEELSVTDLIEEIEALQVEDTGANPLAVAVVTIPVASHSPPTPASTHSDPAARVVLVVDDDASLRAMLVRGLGLTYTVFEADDGVTAMEILERIPHPACVVSDWMMPRMDGVALLKKIRADKELKRIPVILLTAKNAPMNVIEGINSGARAYVAKPFKMKELIDKVTTIVSGRK